MITLFAEQNHSFMKYLLYLCLLLMLVGCGQQQPAYRIEGTVDGNVREGQKVYLVPMENANRGNVDSTYIHEGRFTFEGDTERVSIVRLPIQERQLAQEMLVITEPGVIKVHIGRNSTVAGTPQNEQMQRWKDAMIARGICFRQYMQACQDSLGEVQLSALKSRYDSADASMREVTRTIIDRMKGQTIAKFLIPNLTKSASQ